METTIDGIRLRYALEGQRGSLVVLTHGLGGTLEFWAAHVKALAAHHRVLVWDLRGAGGSARPPGPYDVCRFASDLAGLLEHLRETRAHLIGHSGGGVVSLRFALDFPGRVESLVLASTSSEVGEAARRGWHRLADTIERQGFGPEREPGTRGFGPAFVESHPEVVREVARRARENDPAAYAATARAFGSYHFTPELPRIAAPTLILQGLEDRLTPPGGSVILSRGIRRSRLLMVPGAGHYVPLEMPALFDSVVLAFLAGLERCEPS